LRGVTLEDVAIERVEGEKILIELTVRPDLGKHAALRCIWIDIVEMAEVRRGFEIAEGRDPMGFIFIVSTYRHNEAETHRRNRQGAGRKPQHPAARHKGCWVGAASVGH